MPTNTHVFETRMSKRMQVSFYKKPVFRSFVNTEERSNLKNGQSVTRPYRSLMRSQAYTRNGSLTFQDLTDTNETLTINTINAVPFQIDDFDAVQSNFKLQREYANDAMLELNSGIDADVLSEVANALNVVDDADFGGSSGDPIALDASNVFQVFTALNRKLQENNIDVTGMDPRLDDGVIGAKGLAGFMVMSPYFSAVLTEAEQNRETVIGDRTGLNGYVKSRGSLDLMLSNNSYWSAVLGLATQPTDGDTVVIGGVTFTFKTTLGSTAGNVLIGASADEARANLAALINAPGTTTALGVALSNTRSFSDTRSDREKIEDLVATNDNTANTLTLTADGGNYVVLSETLTDATDGWSKETQHLLAGRKGCVDMVDQVSPTVKTSDIEDGYGIKVKPCVLYGLKTFREGARRMVNVKINTANLV
jgi:hypothetical protein